MPTLPQFQTIGDGVSAKDFGLLQNTWGQIINQVLNNPLNQANILKDVQLVMGVNVVNHLLGRKMQGWFLTDIQSAANIYRSAPFNSQTLVLTSSGSVTVSIGVF